MVDRVRNKKRKSEEREKGSNGEKRCLLVLIDVSDIIMGWDRCPSRTSNTLTHTCTHHPPWALVSLAEAGACHLQSDRITLNHQERKRRKKQDACGGWQFDFSACYFHS